MQDAVLNRDFVVVGGTGTDATNAWDSNITTAWTSTSTTKGNFVRGGVLFKLAFLTQP